MSAPFFLMAFSRVLHRPKMVMTYKGFPQGFLRRSGGIMRKAIVLIFIVSLVPVLSHAQKLRTRTGQTGKNPPGMNQPVSMGDLDALRSELYLADARHKADLLGKLGVAREFANRVVENLLPYELIEVNRIRVPGAAQYGFAFWPGSACGLYLLHRDDGKPQQNSWHAIARADMDCWYGSGSATLELMALRRADADDIVVHHLNSGHGTGIAVGQTKVFSVLDDKLVETMATEDYLHEVTVGSGRETERHSTFLLFPNRSLEETRSTAIDGDLEMVERRFWQWSAQSRKFVAGPFVTVSIPR